MMRRVFLDSSVLFAAVYSTSGAARDLLNLAIAGQIQLIVSRDVLTETGRNLSRKAPEVVAAYQQLLELLNLEIVADPTLEAVQAAEAYVEPKDAPIVAAAISAQPDYLATYDRKHLLDPPEVAARSGLAIVTPDVVVAALDDETTSSEEA